MTIEVSRFLEDQKIIRHTLNPLQPLVSVCLTTHRLRPGGSNQRAIESVLSQSFSNFEFIIVDDGSLDGLYSILLEYQKRDSRIVIIRHEINSGLPAIRVNEALMIARGHYIAYMFDDDEWLPDALKHLVETAEQESGNCAVYGIVDWIIHRPNGEVEHTLLGDWDFNYSLLKNYNRMANCAVLHPRSVLNICGLYDPHILLRRSCDYDLWLRMARVIPFRRSPHIVGKVTSGTIHALGSNVNQDLVLSYRYLNTERDERLRTEEILHFGVDSLDFVSDVLDAHRIRENYIIPFWQQHPSLLQPSERKRILVSKYRPNRLLVTKGDYSTSVDVTLGNFIYLLSDSHLSLAYMQEGSLQALNRWNFDTLILYRTIGSLSLKTLVQAHKWGKSVLYLMDDNMFRFGTGYLSEEFSYLKPESPGFKVLSQEVRDSDLVVSYSPVITEDCKEYNSRVVELSTNIQERHIINAEPLEGGKETRRRLKYAILSGSARKEELAFLWNIFQEFSRRYSEDVEFHVWGINPSNFGNLECPVFYKQFNHSYDAYLRALKTEKFDYVICPLFDDHESKKSKSPIKYLEATAAGAVGIYSDVDVYSTVVSNVNGLKTRNNPEEWLEILEMSFNKTTSERSQLHSHAKADILKSFTTESQVLTFLSAFEAAQLHHDLNSKAAENGRAVIAYFFHEALLGGATLHLMQHALFLKQYGFQPIFCFQKKATIPSEVLAFAEEHGFLVDALDFHYFIFPKKVTREDRRLIPSLKNWMLSHDVRFVHMVTLIPSVALAARELKLPCIATLHAYYEAPPNEPVFSIGDDPLFSAIHSSSLLYADKWQSVLDVPAYCIRAPIANEYFEQFEVRCSRKASKIPTLLISGTLQPRKGQLKVIKAIHNLQSHNIYVKLILLGYDNLLPAYVNECHQAIKELNLTNYVSIPGFSSSPKVYYDEADYVVCSSDEESMPQSILKAMASRIRVISTPVGGVKELILDGFSGVVSNGYDVKDLQEAIERAVTLSDDHWEKMVENAHFTAHMTCSYEVVTNKLLNLYNLAIQNNKYPARQTNNRNNQIVKTSIITTLLNLRYIQIIKSKLRKSAMIRELYRFSKLKIKEVMELITLVRNSEGFEKKPAPLFKELRYDSVKFQSQLQNYMLTPSLPLNLIDFREYRYEFKRANLKSISMALTLDFPPTTGIVGVEIVSPEGKITTQVINPLAGLDIQSPVIFEFDPIADTQVGIWQIRIFVRNVDTIVKIYEWKKINIFRRGFISRKGFMGFSFVD